MLGWTHGMQAVEDLVVIPGNETQGKSLGCCLKLSAQPKALQPESHTRAGLPRSLRIPEPTAWTWLILQGSNPLKACVWEPRH